MFWAFRGSHPNVSVFTQGAVFRSVISASGKLDITNAAVLSAIDTDKIEKWDKLYRKIKRRLRCRNELAHFSAWIEEDKPPGDRIFLAPGQLKQLGAAAMGQYSLPGQYNIKQLKEAAESFDNLADQIINFVEKEIESSTRRR